MMTSNCIWSFLRLVSVAQKNRELSVFHSTALSSRDTLWCHLQYSGVPWAYCIRFSIYLQKIHFQIVIKPERKLVWVLHWVPQVTFLFCRIHKPNKFGKHWPIASIPHGVHGLTFLDCETIEWLFNIMCGLEWDWKNCSYDENDRWHNSDNCFRNVKWTHLTRT